MDGKKRTKVDRVCNGIASATFIAAGTAGVACHINNVIKEKRYGFFDGLADVFAVGFICDGIRGLANAICDDENGEDSNTDSTTDKK